MKKDNMIGKNFISGLLTVLRRPVYVSDPFLNAPEVTTQLSLPHRVRCPKGAKNGLWELHRQRPSKAARTPIEHDERSSSM